MDKINIGFIISYVGPYGPANIMYNIIKFLPKEKYNVYLIIIDKKHKYEDNERFIDLGVKIIHLNVNKYRVLFYKIKNLQKIVEENNIQILHSHCLASSIFISKLETCKKIATIHCNIREDFKLGKNIIVAKLMEYLYLNSLKKVDLKICCSKSIKEEIEKYSLLKIKYIQNGVDLSKFTVLNLNKDKLKIKLGLNLQKKYFIVVGRFSERKQIYFIAKEFSRLNLKNYGLLLVGSSYGEGIIENKIEQLENKNIIMPGRVSNVNEYLNASDYFISASLYEGLPNSVLEACCTKLPLILSDIGPHKEILNLSPKAGLLFRVRDNYDFSKKILEIIKKDPTEMQENSFKIVKKYLNAEQMSKNYSEQYERLMLE